MRLLTLVGTILYGLSANAFCFKEAAAQYQLNPQLLKSIAIRESALNPKAINDNGSKLGKDYGLMQINSRHFPELIKKGVIQSSDELLTNPCLNVKIGAWILAKHLRTCGVSWNCLGSYNAGFARDRSNARERYANRIYTTYISLRVD